MCLLILTARAGHCHVDVMNWVSPVHMHCCEDMRMDGSWLKILAGWALQALTPQDTPLPTPCRLHSPHITIADLLLDLSRHMPVKMHASSH